MTENEFFKRYSFNPEMDLLGSGGFGSVYKAIDKETGQNVAIKIAQVKDILGKFTLLNEVELSKTIDDHPNVARYEFGLRVIHPFPVDYAVMPYYEDGNLDMLLKRNKGVLESHEYRDIVEGLLEGIAHLHNENIIHRDLKLSNILMFKTKQGQWRPKIADFGLSRQTENSDRSLANSAIGITVAFASPEQIEGGAIRKNVDLWSFAVVIYRLLTGEMPFEIPVSDDSMNVNQIISKKIVNMQLPEKLDNIEEPYQQIIRRCWVKNVSERAQSANELLKILNGQVLELPTVESTFRLTPQPPIVNTKPVIAPDKSFKISLFLLIAIGLCIVVLLSLWIWELSTPQPASVPLYSTLAKDNEAFERTKKTGILADYQKYVLLYPNSRNVRSANDSIQKLSNRFKNLLNDAEVFLNIKEYNRAKTLLDSATLISPDEEAVKKLLERVKNKEMKSLGDRGQGTDDRD